MGNTLCQNSISEEQTSDIDSKEDWANLNDCIFLCEKKVTITLIGDTNIGKTTLLNGFINGYITEHTRPTIAVNHVYKDIYKDFTKYNIHFWDMSGDPIFSVITSSLVTNSDVFIMFYGTDNKKSIKYVQHILENPNIYKISSKSRIILIGIGCGELLSINGLQSVRIKNLRS